jgi:hypothetical protein
MALYIVPAIMIQLGSFTLTALKMENPYGAPMLPYWRTQALQLDIWLEALSSQ